MSISSVCEWLREAHIADKEGFLMDHRPTKETVFVTGIDLLRMVVFTDKADEDIDIGNQAVLWLEYENPRLPE